MCLIRLHGGKNRFSLQLPSSALPWDRQLGKETDEYVVTEICLGVVLGRKPVGSLGVCPALTSERWVWVLP